MVYTYGLLSIGIRKEELMRNPYKLKKFIKAVQMLFIACMLSLYMSACSYNKDNDIDIDYTASMSSNNSVDADAQAIAIDNESNTMDISNNNNNLGTLNEGEMIEPKSQEISKSSIIYTDIYYEDFESNSTSFGPRGDIRTELVKDGYDSNYAFMATERTETWQGPIVDITEMVMPEGKYEFSAWVKYNGIPDKKRINLMIEHNNGISYINCGSIMAVNGEWVNLTGSVTIPSDSHSAYLYFETDYKSLAEAEDLIDIYIDDVIIKKVDIAVVAFDIVPLYKVHEDYFKIGVGMVALDATTLEYTTIITEHFNSITMGNEMKPDYILDYTTCSSNPKKYNLEPAIHYDNLDVGLRFAKENGLQLRGHTLVWHSQTPEWFFKENYSKDEDAPLVSKEVMLARLESYIRQVMTYCQENYPGVVYAWDVVNEAIETGHMEEGGYRSKDSLWYQTIGPEFVEMAFTYARKYADKDVKLFYNDYNCHLYDRRLAIYNLARMLKEKGVIDGIGMQSHYGLSDPSVMTVQETLTKFGELGLEIHITELDINTDDGSEEGLWKLAIRYRRLMSVYRYAVDNELADITSITIWGLSDKGSWLNDSKRKYPLLFDDYLQPKDAFWGFYLHDSIPNF